MVDLDRLKASGLTDENLKTWFNIDPLVVPKGDPGSPEEKRAALFHRLRSRTSEGRDRNFQDFKVHHALDKAWDTPFRQLSPTLVQEFLDQDPNEEKVYQAFQDWGMTNLIEEKTDAKTGKKVKSINVPVFFQIFVPLVRSYVTIRWAKIMNDRRLTPFFKFEPIKQTTVLNAKCEALTDRIQIISSQYGYFDVMKQAVLKMLHYGTCFQFPKMEWHWEEHEKLADEIDVAAGKKTPAGTPAKVGDVVKQRSREGIPYHLPHPTRTFYDIAHGPYTFNYDYGCEFAGYWRIARYREIAGNAAFWNTNKIALGNVDLIGNNPLFFQTVYSACTLRSTACVPPPKAPDGNALAAEIGVGTASSDRERQLANLYYGTEHGDQGVMVTEYFERLIPADNGLGTYTGPVWMRFMLAGDSCTILYAAPLPYCPVIYYGYDADESRTKNPSLSLEVLPFQDHFSQILSQTILTCKQNLANMAFVDEDQLLTGDTSASKSREIIDKIQNIGEKLYRSLNIFSYSSKRAAKMQAGPARNGVPDVVQGFSFPKGNIQEMTNVLKTILDILERVLVMSSQEIAQAASHELRVDEVRNIQASTSSRLQFTATPVDIARDAWKRQLYSGLMAYGDDDFYAHIPSDAPLTKEMLTAMGFTFMDNDKPTASDRFVRVKVNKKKTAMNLWEFSSSRDGEDRLDSAKIAMAMAQFVQSYMANPMTAQAIGAAQAIELANYIARLAGLPRDFKLRDMSPSPQEQQAAAQQQLKQVVIDVLGVVNKEIKPIADLTERNAMELGVVFKRLGLPLVDNLNPANDSIGPSPDAGGQGGEPPPVATPVGLPASP